MWSVHASGTLPEQSQPMATPARDAASIAAHDPYAVPADGVRPAHGDAASSRLQEVTHAYYDSISTAYTPAIYHGQDSGHGGRCGLCLNACSTGMFKKSVISRHVENASPNF